jgi:ribosomal protein S18 acetylase RimI-like enzyme
MHILHQSHERLSMYTLLHHLSIDHRRDNEVIGFIECSTQEGTKYGMGATVPEADVRPVISNLAVDARYRRYGIGSSLLRACEDAVKEWGYDEIVLQVEDDNVNAKAFYEKQGFDTLFMDRAARRYDTVGSCCRMCDAQS